MDSLDEKEKKKTMNPRMFQSDEESESESSELLLSFFASLFLTDFL